MVSRAASAISAATYQGLGLLLSAAVVLAVTALLSYHCPSAEAASPAAAATTASSATSSTSMSSAALASSSATRISAAPLEDTSHSGGQALIPCQLGSPSPLPAGNQPSVKLTLGPTSRAQPLAPTYDLPAVAPRPAHLAAEEQIYRFCIMRN